MVIINPMTWSQSPPPGADAPSRSHAAQGRDAPPVVVDANALFGTRRELLIDHAGARYRLQITRNNKLILTK